MKARAVFDTLTYANRLKAAGLDDKIAETQAEANADMVANLLDSGLVSQESFQLGLTRLETKIHSAEARLDAKIQLTRSDLTQQMIQIESNLRQEIKHLETRLTIRLGGIMVGTITITATLLSLLHIIH